MPSPIMEIAADTYRISLFNAEHGIQYNAFLIADDEPFLMHTGLRRMAADTLAAIRRVMDPARLRWIGFSHFESDECGALNELLRIAPRATAACSVVGAQVTVGDFADRAPRALGDGEVLSIGKHRLRFLATPHVPHCWDAGLFFDEGERTLFCSDLFFHPGDAEPLATTDIVGRAQGAMRASRGTPFAGSLPYTARTDATLQRLAALAPHTLGVMHGSSYQGDGGAALRDLATVIRGEAS